MEKIFYLMDLAFQLCSTMGEKVKTYEMLEIIYQRVCLKDNGKKWRDLLTKCLFK